jgi:DNA-binding SARP family transcriptional activator
VVDVRFGLLGPVEVRHDGQVLPLGGMRPRAVLAVLLLAGGAPVTEQRLVAALWGEDLPASARNSLQSHVSRLRAALGPVGERLRREAAGYRLVLAPGEVDVHRVESLAARARAARVDDPAGAARAFGEALALWRGPALAEFAELPGLEASGLAADQVRLDELRHALREDLLDARLAAGEHAELLPDLEAAAAADPLRERPHRLLTTALYRCGRATDALTALRRYRERLAEETGLDPTGELAGLEAAVLAGDPALDGPGPRPAADPPHTALLVAPANTFYGRYAERAALAAALRTHRLVTVTGPGGVGKTGSCWKALPERPNRSCCSTSSRCATARTCCRRWPCSSACARPPGPRCPTRSSTRCANDGCCWCWTTASTSRTPSRRWPRRSCGTPPR